MEVPPPAVVVREVSLVVVLIVGKPQNLRCSGWGDIGVRYLGVMGRAPLTGSQGMYNCGTINAVTNQQINFGANWWTRPGANNINRMAYFIKNSGSSSYKFQQERTTQGTFGHVFTQPGTYTIALRLNTTYDCGTTALDSEAEPGQFNKNIVWPCSWDSCIGFCGTNNQYGGCRADPGQITNFIFREFTVVVSAPPQCEVINVPASAIVGQTYNLTVKATATAGKSIRRVSLYLQQAYGNYTTLIDNSSCNGQTCNKTVSWTP